MNLFRAPIIVLDTETTGIPGRHPHAEIVELAAVLLDVDGREIAEFSSLVRPAFDGPEIDGALEINQITRAMLAEAPPMAEVAPKWSAWCTAAGATYWTSFNVGFDRQMMDRHGLTGRWASCVMLRALDAMNAAGAAIPGKYGRPKWPKLSEAAEFFRVPQQEPAHRALADARTAALIATAIRHAELGATP